MVDLAPCRNCPRRHIGCHGTCVDYLAYKDVLTKEHQKRREYIYGLVTKTDACIKIKKNFYRRKHRDATK